MTLALTKVGHSLRVSNGKEISLPPNPLKSLVNMRMPDIETPDSIQQYPLGTIFREDDRSYRYCYFTANSKPYWGVYKPKKTNTVAVAPVQATGAGAIGSVTVTVTIDTEIGILTTGVLSENELAGGYVVIGNGSNQYPQTRRIVSHPALATTGGSLTLTIDRPLGVAVTAATTTIELMECMYYCVKGDGLSDGYSSFIGVPACVVTSGQWAWVQTYGPVWITSDSNTCDSANDREIFFVANGSVVSGGSLTYQGSSYQRAGFALDMSGSSASNAPFVFLQLVY
jgi:hypothetical protein